MRLDGIIKSVCDKTAMQDRIENKEQKHIYDKFKCNNQEVAHNFVRCGYALEKDHVVYCGCHDSEKYDFLDVMVDMRNLTSQEGHFDDFVSIDDIDLAKNKYSSWN